MPKLHPTLWRTCRVLAGPTRLELFRLVGTRPDQRVSDLARQLNLSLPRASQELRRLQSRGLIQAVRLGRFVLYRPVADRLVSTAPVLLQAMQETFRLHPPAEDEQALRIAIAGSHDRRLLLLRLLLKAPWNSRELETTTAMGRDSFHRHVSLLRQGGLVQRTGRTLAIRDNPHPLAQALVGLLRDRSPAATPHPTVARMKAPG